MPASEQNPKIEIDPEDQYGGPEIEAIAIDKYGRVVNVDKLLNGLTQFPEFPGQTIRQRWGLAREHVAGVVEVEIPKCRIRDMPEALLDGQWRLECALAEVGARPLGMATAAVFHGQGMQVTNYDRAHSIVESVRSGWGESSAASLQGHGTAHTEDLAVQVASRVMQWLAAFVEFSANSPLYRGRYSGHDGYRMVQIGRLPHITGFKPMLTREEYEAAGEIVLRRFKLLKPDGSPDWTRLHFEARPSKPMDGNETADTTEFRGVDVPCGPARKLLLSWMIQGLILTELRNAIDIGIDGLGGDFISERRETYIATKDGHPEIEIPGQGMMDGKAAERALFDHISDALKDFGVYDEARKLFEEAMRLGTGSEHQKDLIRKIIPIRQKAGLPIFLNEDHFDDNDMQWAMDNMFGTDVIAPLFHPELLADLHLASAHENSVLTHKRRVTSIAYQEQVANRHLPLILKEKHDLESSGDLPDHHQSFRGDGALEPIGLVALGIAPVQGHPSYVKENHARDTRVRSTSGW